MNSEIRDACKIVVIAIFIILQFKNYFILSLRTA